MRTSLGKSRIPWEYRIVCQLLTARDRFFEHLEPLFLHTRLLPDGFLLRQASVTAARYYQCQSIDLDGISCELLGAREKQYYSNDWLSRFDSDDAVIFVVPLSAYCRDDPASTTPLVSEIYTF